MSELKFRTSFNQPSLRIGTMRFPDLEMNSAGCDRGIFAGLFPVPSPSRPSAANPL